MLLEWAMHTRIAENAVLFLWKSLTPQKNMWKAAPKWFCAPIWFYFRIAYVTRTSACGFSERMAHLSALSVDVNGNSVLLRTQPSPKPCLRLFHQNLYVVSGKSLTEKQTEGGEICFLNLLSETSCATFLLGAWFHGSGRISGICILESYPVCYLYSVSLLQLCVQQLHST